MHEEHTNEKGEDLTKSSDDKIEVCKGFEGFREFTERHPGCTFCPYLADKTDKGWADSTSRVYMNQLQQELPDFFYVPVNVGKDNLEGLTTFFEGVVGDSRVVAVNITQPHKSNPVVMRLFDAEQNGIDNIDTLVRGADGAMHPYDRDAPAFMAWYNEEVGSFADKAVVMIGAGGAGGPIAQLIAKQQPDCIVIVDPSDKTQLIHKLEQYAQVFYSPTIDQIASDLLAGELVIINAAGNVGMSPELTAVLSEHGGQGNIFVDIRAQLELDSVKAAQGLKWQAYTGYGMNATNDYALVGAIAEAIGGTLPSFEKFKDLVARAS